MKLLKHITLAALCAVSAISYASAPDFSLGADISGVSYLEAGGQKFLDAKGKERDLYDLMKDYGINGVRLRVWVDPEDGFCSPEDVLGMALRAKEKGLPVMVDFHYSDWWADPGKQNVPARWKNMNLDRMQGALAEHTASTLQMLKHHDIDVPWVQVGNETTNGMLWDMASLPQQTRNYAQLTQAGYDAVKSVYPDAQVIVHLDNGWDEELYNRVFDGLKRNGAKWDMIGMSLYPFWSMPAGQVKSEKELADRAVKNIRDLKKKYGTDIMVVEVGVEANDPEPGKAFLSDLIERLQTETDGACRGVWYWAPEADGVLDGYKLGAFRNRKPTVIMDAFREAAAKMKKK